jgi:hypothetical protein
VLDRIDQRFLLFTFGLALDPDMGAAVEHHVELLLAAVGAWDSGRRYLNFTESRVDPRRLFPEESWDRLCEVKARYDPEGLFVANHSISPGQ